MLDKLKWQCWHCGACCKLSMLPSKIKAAAQKAGLKKKLTATAVITIIKKPGALYMTAGLLYAGIQNGYPALLRRRHVLI